jgi:hypothetical protein
MHLIAGEHGRARNLQGDVDGVAAEHSKLTAVGERTGPQSDARLQNAVMSSKLEQLITVLPRRSANPA